MGRMRKTFQENVVGGKGTIPGFLDSYGEKSTEKGKFLLLQLEKEKWLDTNRARKTKTPLGEVALGA